MTAWAELVGGAHVAAGTREDAVDGVVPAWVVRPGSVDEVQACVRAAAGAGAALVASGLGAHLGLGAPPTRLDVLLRLDRLARVVEHQAADMTVTVEAGCPLPTLAAALARAGQWLPLDPPAPDGTTVGGLIAGNLSGPLRASQGRVRDLLLGVRVVGAGGVLVASGGRVVKNVAGYDLPKLHVGALGTLGVLVEATFKVRPRPEQEEAVAVACSGLAAAAQLALALRDGGLPPLWIELAGPGAFAEGAAVVAGLGGLAEEVQAARAAVVATAEARGCETRALGAGAETRARLAGFAHTPAAAVLRAAVLPTDVAWVMDALGRRGAARTLAHAANGVVRAAVADAAAVAPLVRALRPEVEARGGALVLERARPEVKAGLDVWGGPGPGFPLMQRLKDAFDPARTFAPGRFVGGL